MASEGRLMSHETVTLVHPDGRTETFSSETSSTSGSYSETSGGCRQASGGVSCSTVSTVTSTVDPNSDYLDLSFNVPVGSGVGLTAGLILGANGRLRPQLGAGLMTSGGVSLTTSRDTASSGDYWGFAAGFGAGFQYGSGPFKRPNESTYFEWGGMTPGFSLTLFHIFDGIDTGWRRRGR
jgi:hypothetical protein